MKKIKTSIIVIFAVCFFFNGFSLAMIIHPGQYIDTTQVYHKPVKFKPDFIFLDKQAIFSAYTLSKDETDDTPCIGAGNHDLCQIVKENPDKCIVATRKYPLHTIIQTIDFGECEVLDRTSERYGDRIDVLFKSREEAIKFGIKKISYKAYDFKN